MEKSVSVILSGYRRGHLLEEQYQAILNQTYPVSETLLWYNNPEGEEPNYTIGTQIPTAYCTYNFGVWARFAFALNAKSEYVCVFDDDTVPGRKWIENCINTIKERPGLLGTVGLLYTNPSPPTSPQCSYYEHYDRFGWVNPNNHTRQVDLVGHAWFFRREWLSDYWRELPDPKYNLCGEDMHFSYMLQKYRKLGTYVPPHPPEDHEMWGSTKGAMYGVDQNSLWETNKQTVTGAPFKQAMHDYFVQQRRSGWNLINSSRIPIGLQPMG